MRANRLGTYAKKSPERASLIPDYELSMWNGALRQTGMHSSDAQKRNQNAGRNARIRACFFNLSVPRRRRTKHVQVRWGRKRFVWRSCRARDQSMLFPDSPRGRFLPNLIRHDGLNTETRDYPCQSMRFFDGECRSGCQFGPSALIESLSLASPDLDE